MIEGNSADRARRSFRIDQIILGFAAVVLMTRGVIQTLELMENQPGAGANFIFSLLIAGAFGAIYVVLWMRWYYSRLKRLPLEFRERYEFVSPITRSRLAKLLRLPRRKIHEKEPVLLFTQTNIEVFDVSNYQLRDEKIEFPTITEVRFASFDRLNPEQYSTTARLRIENSKIWQTIYRAHEIGNNPKPIFVREQRDFLKLLGRCALS